MFFKGMAAVPAIVLLYATIAASAVPAFMSMPTPWSAAPCLTGASSGSGLSLHGGWKGDVLTAPEDLFATGGPLRLRGGSVERRAGADRQRGVSPNAHAGGKARGASSPAQHAAGGATATSPSSQAPRSSSWASIVGKAPSKAQPSPEEVSADPAYASSAPGAAAAAPAVARPPPARGASSFAPRGPAAAPAGGLRASPGRAPATAMRAKADGAEEEEEGGGGGGDVEGAAAGGEGGAADAVEGEDDYYFNSYSHFGIHEEMLKDEARTFAYRDALIKNAHILKGKTVLDVGCGTGILSMFAAQAGAKHVYAVDNSDMAYTCKEIVRVNGFSDVITVIKGDVETLELPIDKVDVIVSEWMGYSLLYEAMLDTVLVARDKWLAPGGILMPDKASIYLTGIEDAKYKDEKIHFWDDVYGFNMSTVKTAALSEPLVDTVDPGQLATTTCCIWEADLMTIKKEELTVDTPFKLSALRNDYVHALVAHFDVGFTMMHKPTWLTTSPRERPTHWRQSVIYLHDELAIKKGQEITGEIRISPNRQNKRHLDYRLRYAFNGEAVNGVAGVDHKATHYYGMR